ncbi:MAG: YlbF family regulator [Oscillospiraceae bacterium]|nr:YlbF family regulator [Oscillospiraceae bacterium]
MDVIEVTRQLGAAIQADDRYLTFMEAKKAADNDANVQLMLSQIEAIRTQYQNEASKPAPDQASLQALDQSFQTLYQQVMANETMQAANAAGQEIDSMMNYIMQILSLCVNGEDPATCEPKAQEGCGCEGGDCGSCGGGCGSEGCGC